MITSYTLDLGRLEIYDNYLKGIINEGATISPECNNILIEIAKRHYNNKAFVYISERINSYAVNPTIYIETSKIRNLAGLAIVSNNPIQKAQAQLEKVFFNKELKQFDTIELAFAWKDEILKKYHYLSNTLKFP